MNDKKPHEPDTKGMEEKDKKRLQDISNAFSAVFSPFPRLPAPKREYT